MQIIDLIPRIRRINLIVVTHPIVAVAVDTPLILHILRIHRTNPTATIVTTAPIIPTATAIPLIATVILPMLPIAIVILRTAVQPQQGVHQVHLEARLEMQDYCLEEQLLLHMGFIRRVPKRKSKTEDRILLARD